MTEPTIFCAVPVVGRELETRVTLLSLAQNNMIADIHVQVFLGSRKTHPGVPVDYVRGLLSEARIPHWGIEEIPQEGWDSALRHAFRAFLGRAESWLWWLENDNLVNPNCVEDMLEHERAAALLRCVGLISPQRLRGSTYRNEDVGGQYPFLFRRRVQATTLFIRRELAQLIADVGWLDGIPRMEGLIVLGLLDFGCSHVVARRSTVQHIGLGGLTTRTHKRWAKGGNGGCGFVPHPAIAGLAQEIYQQRGLGPGLEDDVLNQST